MGDSSSFKEQFNIVWKIDKFWSKNNARSPKFTYREKSFCLVLKTNVKKYFDEDTYDIYIEGELQPNEWQETELYSCIKSAYDIECFSCKKSVDDQVVKMKEPIWSVNRRDLLERYDEMKKIDGDSEIITFESSQKNARRQSTESKANSVKKSEENGVSNHEDLNNTSNHENGFNKESKLILAQNMKTGETDLDYSNYHPGRAPPDFQLKCGKYTFLVHKQFLQSKCKKFAAAVLNENSDVNEIFDVDWTVLMCFLQYAYDREIPNMTEDVVPGLHSLACKYGVKDLTYLCAQFWFDHEMSQPATCELLRSAYDHDDELAIAIIGHVIRYRRLMKYLDLSSTAEKHRQLVYQVYRDYIKAHSLLFKF